jgi:formamidopyrimidine-DNA glycosylase
MPEGPEVRRMAEGLAQRIEGRSIVKAEILGGKWLKKAPTGIEIIQKELAKGPAEVKWVSVKGKFIYASIGDIWMWNTLGMSGGWRDQQGKHAHFSFELDNGRLVYFDDVRRFGNISFYGDFLDIQKKLKDAGPDLLNEDVGLETFKERLTKRGHKNICQLLMDQKVLSGIGNYIKSEALYRAGISPHLKANEISDQKMERLWEWSRKIIKTSYDQGGATLATYTDMDGNRGEFVFSFHVYRKETDPLGNPIVHEVTQDGRMTHWVPQIQN